VRQSPYLKTIVLQQSELPVQVSLALQETESVQCLRLLEAIALQQVELVRWPEVVGLQQAVIEVLEIVIGTIVEKGDGPNHASSFWEQAGRSCWVASAGTRLGGH
jgi:hypothetical protein